MQVLRRSEAWWVVGCFVALSGCGLAPELEDVLNPPNLKYEVKSLTPAALDERIRKIDESYSEERSRGRVLTSYELCLDSISPGNGYAALWRGARACYWLAENSPVKSEREEYAIKGIAMGKEAIKKASNLVESHYYLALCYAAVADIRRQANRELLTTMRDRMLMAKSIDEKYDYCGAHRFLGELMVQTDPYPLYAIGSIDEGLAHLKKAVELCPEYGENSLAYAKGLHAAELDTQAMEQLDKVLASPRPKDRTVEHQAWLEEAAKLQAQYRPDA
jgi:tetratricopeptide (TPR) repeat protein